MRSNLRYAEENKRSLMKCEFQELIEKGATQLREFEIMDRVSKAKKAIGKDSCSTNMIELALSLNDLAEVLKLRTTSTMNCQLIIWQVRFVAGVVGSSHECISNSRLRRGKAITHQNTAPRPQLRWYRPSPL